MHAVAIELDGKLDTLLPRMKTGAGIAAGEFDI